MYRTTQLEMEPTEGLVVDFKSIIIDIFVIK